MGRSIPPAPPMGNSWVGGGKRPCPVTARGYIYRGRVAPRPPDPHTRPSIPTLRNRENKKKNRNCNPLHSRTCTRPCLYPVLYLLSLLQKCPRKRHYLPNSMPILTLDMPTAKAQFPRTNRTLRHPVWAAQSSHLQGGETAWLLLQPPQGLDVPLRLTH